MYTSTSNDRVYFQYLDIVRFVAATMVVILHAYEAWAGNYGYPAFMSSPDGLLTHFGFYMHQLIMNFCFGVDIFFLISGFLITYLLLEEKKRYGKISIWRFMTRRALRIWPVYYLLLALTPILANWIDFGQPTYWTNLLFLGNLEVAHTQTWISFLPHYWTICVEEHFYLVWPFVVALIPRKHLLSILVLFIVGCVAFRVNTAFTLEYPWFTLFAHTLSRADVIVIGAIGGYFYAQKPFEFKLPFLVRISCLILLIGLMAFEPYNLMDSVFQAGFKKYTYVFLAAVLILDFNFNPDRIRLLKSKSIIHYLGKISYGVYMYGNVLIYIVLKKIMWNNDMHEAWIFILILGGMTIVIPIISFELIEKQFLKLSKRFKRIPTR